MSASHHHDPIEDNIETHPVKLAIGIVLGVAALIVAIILIAQFAIGLYGARSMKDDPSMSPEAVAKRIAPVARVVIDPKAPAAPAAAAAAAPAATPAPAAAPPAAIPPAAPAKAADAGAAGKSTYDGACAVCHGTGVAGAPKFGDKAAWSARAQAGKDAMYASALKGKGAMPPKGGNASLSDDAVKAAVDYLLAAAK